MNHLLSLVGHPHCGKSTISARLESEFGFTNVSGSAILRESAEAEGAQALILRKDFDNYHRSWRERNGINAMGIYVVNLSQSGKSVCFENLRNKYDAATIKRAGGLIIGMTCPIEIRFARAKAAQSTLYDDYTIESFRSAEEPEYNSIDRFGSHVSHILDKTDITIDGSLEPDEVFQSLVDQIAFPN